MHAPPVNRITDACENITLPHFVAGGKNVVIFVDMLNDVNLGRLKSKYSLNLASNLKVLQHHYILV